MQGVTRFMKAKLKGILLLTLLITCSGLTMFFFGNP